MDFGHNLFNSFGEALTAWQQQTIQWIGGFDTATLFSSKVGWKKVCSMYTVYCCPSQKLRNWSPSHFSQCWNHHQCGKFLLFESIWIYLVWLTSAISCGFISRCSLKSQKTLSVVEITTSSFAPSPGACNGCRFPWPGAYINCFFHGVTIHFNGWNGIYRIYWGKTNPVMTNQIWTWIIAIFEVTLRGNLVDHCQWYLVDEPSFYEQFLQWK